MIHVCELISGYEYESLPKLTRPARKSNILDDSGVVGSSTGAANNAEIGAIEEDSPANNVH